MLEDIKSREEFIRAIELSPNVRNINKLKIKRIECGNTLKGAEMFNLYYKWLVLKCPYELIKLKRTPSGGIKLNIVIQYGYDWIPTKSGVEFIYLGKEGSIRCIFSQKPEGISGFESYKNFCAVCRKFGVDLSKLAIKNGEEVKKTIEMPKIQLFGIEGFVYKNAHHLDLNSSYMSGIAFQHQELYTVIKEIYSKRKSNKVYKDILTHTYGYFQSQWCSVKGYKFAFAHMSRDAIAFNNRYIERLSEKLKESGRHILAYNTDGIWYTGPIYHDEDEGSGLGQWKNDHINCTIRFKSKGSYEYVDGDGVYHPVVRGRTKLDSIKPREEWKWGDIYSELGKSIIGFTWDESYGIKAVEFMEF